MESDFTNRIFNNATIFILIWDIKGNLLKFNNYIEVATGFYENEVLGTKWMNSFLDEENRKLFMEMFMSLPYRRAQLEFEGKIVCKDCREIYVLWNNIVLSDSEGNTDIVVSMGVDITERKEAERKLFSGYQELEAVYEELAATEEELKQNFFDLQAKEEELKLSEERYRLALEGSRDAIWDWDIKRGKSFVSDRWREMLGYDAEDLRVNHLTWKELIHPEDKERAFQAQRDHLNGKTPFYSSEYRLKTKSGEYKWISVRGKVLRDKNGQPIRIAGSQTDISERKIFEEKINFMAYYDGLTGLPNRTLFEKMLKESIEKSLKGGLKGAVLFLDLDNFKTVNDTYGHLTGDNLLKDVAELLRSFETDNIKVSRFGGDEFVILVHDTEKEEYVTQLASNIVKALNRPWIIKGKEFYNTVSIGIVFFPEGDCDEESILSNADFAMYSVKKAGKDNFRVYSRNMNSGLVERVDMENSLRYALKRKEFILHYQPQIHQKTGEIVGVEALIRWKHPTNGLVSPGEFIPIAEETGLIVPIGEWVLREACRQNKAWQDMGCTKFCISVNLSAQQLKQPDLVNNIRNILKDTGLEPTWLCLEITESIAINDIDFAVKLLMDLKEIGVELALDDFGTGYSSLSYLRKLPINIIKIDRSFVKEINESSHAAAIIEAIIAMSHKMDIKVIAEGIETSKQEEFLKHENCDVAQGYLFSKPLDEFKIIELLSKKNQLLFN